MPRKLDIATCIMHAAETVNMDISPESEVFERLLDLASRRDFDSIRKYMSEVTRGQVDVDLFVQSLRECLETIEEERSERKSSDTPYSSLLALVAEGDEVLREELGLKSLPSYEMPVLRKVFRSALRGSTAKAWRAISRLLTRVLTHYASSTLAMYFVVEGGEPKVRVSPEGLELCVGEDCVMLIDRKCNIRLRL